MNVQATILSKDPLIFTVINNSRNKFIGDARLIAEHFGLDSFQVYVSPQFSIWKKPEPDKVDRVQEIVKFQEEYPNASVTYLCNEEIEQNVFTGSSVRTRHINQNAFIDENLFRPVSVDKEFDAIYTGQLHEFKRHELAKKIESLALVYYGHNYDYLKEISQKIPHATFLNGLPTEVGGNGRRLLSGEEMALAYNRSKVGLCLSAVEGGMYACTEYLLCGIPVVSTESFGGRNDFLDNCNSLIVEAEAASVADAVTCFIEKSPSPSEIRTGALERMKSFRERFFDLVNEDLHRLGHENRDFRDEFGSIFRDKLWKSINPIENLL